MVAMSLLRIEKGGASTTPNQRNGAWEALDSAITAWIEASDTCPCVTPEKQSRDKRYMNIGLYSKCQSYGEQAANGYADADCPKCHGLGLI